MWFHLYSAMVDEINLVIFFMVALMVLWQSYHCVFHSVSKESLAQSSCPLQWRHNECDGVSYHRRLHCSLNPLFRRKSKKISKFRVTGLCEGNSSHKGPVTRKMLPFDDVIMWGMMVRMISWVPLRASTKQYVKHVQRFSVYAHSQWETALHCNAVPHWLGAYTEESLHVRNSGEMYCIINVQWSWNLLRINNFKPSTPD